MKKIITPGVCEESKLICDVTGKPAVAKLAMWFGDGSSHDSQVLEVDLSDEAAEEILRFLQSKNPQIQTRDEPLVYARYCPM